MRDDGPSGLNERIVMQKDSQAEQRWHILVSRQASGSPPFFYAVISTGIVCRPGCPSRLPRQENVRFFDHCEDAMKAGYRPCKRCQPLGGSHPHNDMVLTVCRLIEKDPTQARLSTLASACGYSPSHLQKTFTQKVGISPLEYAKGVRQLRAYRELGQGRSVTESLYAAGYQSASQFYTEFKEFSSLPAGSHRLAGRGEVITFAAAETSLGVLLIAASATGLCWISLGEDFAQQVQELQAHFANAQFCPPDPDFVGWLSQVVGFLDSPCEPLDLPLDIRGTLFQRQVWEALRSIPAGKTMDYQALAERIGKPTAARAVARACASNVLAVVIPCHRILRKDGGLSGYRWGVQRKAQLLEREQLRRTKEDSSKENV